VLSLGAAARRVFRPIKRHRRIVWALVGCFGTAVLLIVATNAYVVLSTEGDATSQVADVPPAEAAIVPGALVQPDGRMSSMLADRVQQAAALWRAGKVRRVLVSGDHHTWSYDEPDTMRNALQRRGVPA
jgi:SanA protein